MNNTIHLIQNAKVHTVDPAHFQAETVVRNGHRIAFVGQRTGALRWFNAARKREPWANSHPTQRTIAGYTRDAAYDEQFVWWGT